MDGQMNGGMGDKRGMGRRMDVRGRWMSMWVMSRWGAGKSG